MITIDLTIGLSVGSVVGFAASRIIDHGLARNRNKESIEINEARQAAKNLRSAFTPTLAQLALLRPRNVKVTVLKEHNFPDIDDFLFAGLPTQAIAIEEYRFAIAGNKKEAYQKTWSEYYDAAKGGIFLGDFLGREDPIGYIENKIHAILQFTETKE